MVVGRVVARHTRVYLACGEAAEEAALCECQRAGDGGCGDGTASGSAVAGTRGGGGAEGSCVLVATPTTTTSGGAGSHATAIDGLLGVPLDSPQLISSARPRFWFSSRCALEVVCQGAGCSTTSMWKEYALMAGLPGQAQRDDGG